MENKACIECGQPYDITQSDAFEPEYFCSAACEVQRDVRNEEHKRDAREDR